MIGLQCLICIFSGVKDKMTKDEFRAYHKEKLKSKGFKVRNSFWYKFIDDIYAVGFHIDHSSYCKGYRCEIGGQIVLSGDKIPNSGYQDVYSIFCFPVEPGKKLNCDISTIANGRYVPREKCNLYTNIFEYENYTVEQLDEYFDANYAQFAPTFLDKNKFLEILCSNYFHFRAYTPEKLLLVCNMCNLDKKEVYDFVKKQGFGKKYHINTLISEYNWEILLD